MFIAVQFLLYFVSLHEISFANESTVAVIESNSIINLASEASAVISAIKSVADFKDEENDDKNVILEPSKTIPLKRDRRPVNLNIKQNLIMNQVLSVYGLDMIKDPLCKNHTKEFKIGLRAFEPWALKMFDSSSKLQAGILVGNLVEFGAYKQCIQIHELTESGLIRGKHCTITVSPHIDIIRKILEFRNVSAKRFAKLETFIGTATLTWSVCVPDSCPPEDVLRHFNKSILSITEGLDLNITIAENHCTSSKDIKPLGGTEYTVLVMFVSVVLIVMICTIIDVSSQEEIQKNVVVVIFSAYSNGKQLFAKNKGSTDLDCLHGIRFLSNIYVVIGHRYLMAMFFPKTNGLEIMDWMKWYTSSAIIGGTVCVDSFFMVSGMLVSYVFFSQVTKTGKFNLIMFYVHRLMRITPLLAVTIVIYATLLQHLGSGPLWYDTYVSLQKPCQYYWWSTLLHIQNYVNPGSMCILQTWYLTCDMQYYFFSPLIIYPLWKMPVLGYINLVFIYVLSILLNFYFAWINEYDGGMPVTNQLFKTKYFQRHYIAPHTRASPYIIGLALGLAIFKTRGKKFKMSPPLVAGGWLISFTLMATVLLASHVFLDEFHDYSRLQASFFLSCSRSAWTVGLVWMIWACVHGYGGPINFVLSIHLFRVLGKIAYSIFLLHMILQFLKGGALKQPTYFSDFEAIYESLADITLMIIVGFIFTICIESPLIKAEGIFLRDGKKQNTKIEPKN